MKLRKFFVLDANVFRVVMQSEEWSERDRELMDKFGEPEINTGGSFTGPPTFSLPSSLRDLMTETSAIRPLTKAFDMDDFGDAKARATVWAAEMTTRITSAIVALRANDDDYSGEEVTNI